MRLLILFCLILSSIQLSAQKRIDRQTTKQHKIEDYLIFELIGERHDTIEGDPGEFFRLYINGERIVKGYKMDKKLAFLAEFLDLSYHEGEEDEEEIFSKIWGRDVVSKMHFAIQQFLAAGWQLEGDLKIMHISHTDDLHLIQSFSR